MSDESAGGCGGGGDLVAVMYVRERQAGGEW